MTQKNRVLAIVYESENNVLYSGTIVFIEQLVKAGYDPRLIDLKDPENFKVLYAELGSGNCAFAFGIQGVGSQLHFKGQNLWHIAKVPFISLHFDHPSHALTNHVTESPYIANLYPYDAFLYDYENYVRPIKNEPRVSGWLKIESNRPDLELIPFDQREIKFLYMKTGVSLAPYEHHINTLPKLLREGVWDRITTAKKNPNLSLCDLACDLFPKETFLDPNNQVEFWAIVKAMDLYLRHQRAIDFVNWLKFQEGAVIIGNGWEAIDKEDALATFKPSIDSVDAYLLYPHAQCLCNTTPYGRDIVHERLILGLMLECAVVTDTNDWIDENLAKAPNLIRFNWAEPLDQQILPRVEAAYQNSPTFSQGRALALDLFTERSSAQTITQTVDAILKLVRNMG